ncbi:hypothetical protein BGZ95_007805 [Linnemannia exigua]|uniref:Homeobox domain-containing protein n=1 Tax=Linnemannia exigua TaxID=604196 RepID=A0AAD4HAR6_9FUNG|nr:hypothetical protein BGZ95_007805 [Linnemannia exigua]
MLCQMDRWVFTEEHVAMLEASFLKNPYVTSSDRSSFAQMIGCGEDKVRNWFSRRRTKAKLEEASTADQIQDDEDMDDQDSVPEKVPEKVPSSLPNHKQVMQTTTVVTPIISAASGLNHTAALTSTSAPTPSDSVEVTQETTTADVPKQAPANVHQGLPEKFTSAEIMKKMARILRGNAIMSTSDVETVVNLMGSADDKVSRKYIINALMHTNAPPVVTEFVSSRGPQIMRGWLVTAKATPNDQENKEIMLRTIAVWAKLPFNYDLLKEFELGKVIRSLTKDKNLDDVVVAKASQLEKHWRRLVMEEMDAAGGDGAASKSSNSGAKSEGSSNKREFQGNGPEGDRTRIKRDRDDGAFPQSSELKLPKFNKGRPSPVPETKKTHIVANAGFFKELLAPAAASSKPSSPSMSKTSTTQLSVTTGAPSKPAARPLIVDSTASPSKPTPSPPATPTTPTTPNTPTSTASISAHRLHPVAIENADEAVHAPASEPAPVSDSVAVPSLTPTAAAAAAIASLIGANSLPTVEPPAELAKPSKPKKVVRFKAAEELEMIRYFEKYNDAEEKEMEAVLLRGDLWRPPPMLMLDNHTERGSSSVERTVQEKREAETLSVNYVREAYIPMSPAEPDVDPMDSTIATVTTPTVPVFEATSDHSAILMSSLAFLTQVASSSGATLAATATTTAAPVVASQPTVGQTQIGSYGTTYGTTGTAYGTTASGYGMGASGYSTGGSGYGTGASGYGTGASGYGTGAAGYGTGATAYGAGVGSYGTYGTGVTSYGTGSASQVQQSQQQTYPYQGYQQPQQVNQAGYDPSTPQAYNFQQQYQQAATTAAPVAPMTAAASAVATSNMDPLALIEMLKQVTGTQQQQQQQQQAGQGSTYGYSQNWPNAN